MSDELWAAVAPLLPPEPPNPKGGRPRCDDRRALEGIVFVARGRASAGSGCLGRSAAARA